MEAWTLILRHELSRRNMYFLRPTDYLPMLH